MVAATLVRSSLGGAPPSRLAGEVDARGLAQVVAGQKGKVVLVNFWATWCEPCRQEYPDLVRLQRRLGTRGVQVVGISTDFANALPAAEKFLAEQKPTFPNYHKRSGGDDQDFAPQSLVCKRSRTILLRGGFGFIFAVQFHIATEGNGREEIFCFAHCAAEEFRPKSERKLENLNADPASSQEMTELMECD